MKKNIRGALSIMKELEIIPNFSELSKEYGIDRRTIAKYWKNGIPSEKKQIERPMKFTKYHEEIQEKFEIATITKKAVYEFLKAKYGEHIGSYSMFTYYLRKHGITNKKHRDVQVRYETAPGNQLQFDWKEDITLESKNGETFTFNIFTATLSYSRYRVFIYSKTKTTEDVLNCIIKTLGIIGGVPETMLTDNMSAIVSIREGKKYKHKIIQQFEKDIDTQIKLCKTRRPNTKGKVESVNRFLNWLLPYNKEFETEQDLIQIIYEVNQTVNLERSQTTHIVPLVLFKKEKEHLRQLPNKILLESYTQEVFVQTVPQTLLVQYKGSGYSVSPQYIGKRVKILAFSNKLHIYYNTQLIAEHIITEKQFNYHFDHYHQGLSTSITNRDIDMEQVAFDNLALLDNLKKGGH